MSTSETIDLAVIPNSPDCEEAISLFGQLQHLPTRVLLLPACVTEVTPIPFLRDLSGYKHLGLEEVREFIQKNLLPT